MKRVICIVCMVFVAGLIADANLLVNGGFEQGYLVDMPGWNAENDHSRVESWAAMDGTNGLSMQAWWTSGGEISQDVVARGASNYTFTIHGYRDPSFTDQNTVSIELDFISDSSLLLLHQEMAVVGEADWTSYSMESQSPAGTALVRVRLKFTSPVASGSAFRWDNALLSSTALMPVNLYVAPGGGHVPPFTNWATASTNIQAAIDMAADGDTVLVSNGVYDTGGRIVHEGLLSRVVVDKAITVRSVNGAEVTAIKGAGPLGDDAVRCVYLGANATMDGFTLTEGHTGTSGLWLTEQCGGGILNFGVVSNCILTGNTAYDRGGASAGGLLNNCLLIDNAASAGGGVYLGTLNHCTLTENVAAFAGGALESSLNNCISYYNAAASYPNNYLFPWNTAEYTCTIPDPGGVGNITDEPLFADAASGDYHLISCSPCVDAGTVMPDIAMDIEGTPRILAWDMGAYEYVDAVYDGDGDGMADCWELANGLDRFEPSDASEDPDGDGLSNLQEHQLGTDPNHNDSDGLTNFLVNGDFEEGYLTDIPGWTTDDDDNRIESWASLTGTNGLAMGGWFNGGAIWQDVTASESLYYAFKIHGYRDVDFSSSFTVTLSMEFMTSDHTVLASHSEVVVGRMGQWAEYGIGALSPIGTELVRVELSFTGPVDAGAFKWDDAELTTLLSAPPSATHYVSPSGGHVAPFSSWADAATNIQEAIDVSSDGDLVLVTNGVYDVGGRVVHDVLTNRVVIDKAITVSSVNGPEVTAIKGGNTQSNALRCVYVGCNARLTGFTLTNGYAYMDSDVGYGRDGGGAYCESSAVLSNCVLTGNRAQIYGGGVQGGILNSCTLIGNRASIGGGMYSSTLNDCTITGNEASTGGGSHRGTLNDCTVTGNEAAHGGGSYYSTLNSCVLTDNEANYGAGSYYGTLINCVLTGNTASYRGGGAYYGVLINCTLTENTSESNAGGAYYSYLYNCIVYYNAAPSSPNIYPYAGRISYTCTTPSPGGIGNVTNAPQFVDRANGDLRLASDSPCIDVGTDELFAMMDIEGTPRPLDGDYDGTASWDMGAYEFVNALADGDGDGMMDDWETANGLDPFDPTDAQEDPDGDGLTSLEEHARRTDPQNPDSDGDGFLDGYEVDADTDPLDPYDPYTPVHYVSPAGSHVPPFVTWATAATNIQSAIAMARPWDRVVVTNGVYSTGVYSTPDASIQDSRVVVTQDIDVVSVNGAAYTRIVAEPGVLCAYLSGGGEFTGFTLDAEGVGIRGGVMCFDGVRLEQCIVRNGSVGADGGNIWSHDAVVRNCLMTEGSSSRGGGIYMAGADARLESCTVADNSAQQGGGVVCHSGTVVNCIIWNNEADDGSDNWFLTDAEVQYTCTSPDPGGAGNTTHDPMLSPGYGLSYNSSCLDSGTSMHSYAVDLAGRVRPLDGDDDRFSNWDIGAYEFVYVFIDSDGDEIPDDWESLNALDPFDPSDASEDPDHDGLTNLDEYILRTDPHSADTDGDGFTDDEEVDAGTDPRDPNSNSAVLYVSPGGGHVAPFDSWATAATNIQAAVDEAVNDNTVLVSNGVYETGGRVVHGSMTNRVAIDKRLVMRSINGPDATTIKGAGPLGDAAVRCVYVGAGAVLDGFTLTGGCTRELGDGPTEQSGGGAWCESGAELTNCVVTGNQAVYGGGIYRGRVFNCDVSQNAAVNYGGGIYKAESTNCIVTGNSARNGAGVCDGGIANSLLSENEASVYGGGSYNTAVRNCKILRNAASAGGGCAYGTIISSVIFGNRGGGAYGRLFVVTGQHCTYGGCYPTGYYAPDVRIHHCAIVGNTGVGVTYASPVDSSVVYDNSTGNYQDSTLTFSCTTPMPSSGSGNITNEPVMASLGHLSVNSPCVGAGNPDSASGVDIDGEEWRNPPSIGCDEVVAGSITGELTVDVWASFMMVATGTPVDFYGSAEGRVSASSWSFGDGSPVVTNMSYLSHSFGAEGTYDVVFHAYNETYPAGVAATVTVEVVDEAIHYVDVNNDTPLAPYTTWETAATVIQDAVDVATDGAVVIVTNGTYETGGRFAGGQMMVNRVVIDKPVVVRSVNGPESTIIKGVGPLGNGAVRCVYLGNGALLQGFTLTNGHTRTTYYRGGEQYGGGAWCHPSGVLSRCVLTGNKAQIYGGGSYRGTLNNCMLSENSAEYGAGAYEGALSSCKLYGNTAGSSGGGSYRGTLNNCLLFGNTAYSGAGSYRAALNNCTLIDNAAEYEGGGSYNDTSLRNCIVYYNTAPADPNVSRYYYGVVEYTCTTPMLSGTGNITNEPVMAAVERLSLASPCIGAGSAEYASGTDIDGESWQIPPSMGCDEVVVGAITGPLNVAIEATFTRVAVGFPIRFTAFAEGRMSGSTWDFGDGSPVITNSAFVSHSFTEAGMHDVVLRGYNEDHPSGVAATVTVEVVAGEVHYVSLSGSTPVAPYMSWSTAATNIQMAIDAATIPGAMVLVASGVYDTGGRAVHDGTMPNRVVIDKLISVRSLYGPEVTIIKGAGPIGNGAVRCAYVGPGALLDGFTLTNGHTRTYGSASMDRYGGGVWCDREGVLTNCVLTGNAARGDGGGAYDGTLNHCTLAGNSAYVGGGACRTRLNGCTLTGNDAYQGGGVSGGTLNDCTLTANTADGYGAGTAYSDLNDCTLANNHAGRRGGGTYYGTVDSCELTGNTASNYGGGASRATVNNCKLTGNAAGVGGGGAHDSTMNNCVLSGNTSDDHGGGASGGTLSSCTFVNNTAGQTGGGAWMGRLKNCIVYYNAAPTNANVHYGYYSSVDYSCTIPNPGGTGNITNGPLFVDALNGDYHLAAGSPCIDAGTNMPSIVRDLEGTPRPLDGDNNGIAAWDMGAYEFLHAAADTDGDGMTDEDEARAGSGINDAESSLSFQSVKHQMSDAALGSFTIRWQSVAGKEYDLMRATDLIEGFSPIVTDIPATPPENSFADTTATNEPAYFYRVQLAE